MKSVAGKAMESEMLGGGEDEMRIWAEFLISTLRTAL